MLNKQRRVKPQTAKAIKDGSRVVKERFGVDEDVCTGDHACIRLSGCPRSPSSSWTIRFATIRSLPSTIPVSAAKLRRGRGGGHSLSVVLPRRRHSQSDPMGQMEIWDHHGRHLHIAAAPGPTASVL